MEFLNKKTFTIVLWIIIIVLAFGIWKSVKYKGQNPDPKLYQMVLVKGGNETGANQVFFGKLNKVNSHYPYLTDVYYLSATSAKTGEQRFNVIKRGSGEIHAPTDKMYINQDAIVYWENVGPASNVAQGIAADKQLK
ncbi:hypothetical protein HZC21_05830 [Candidatus Peregrinibacteria bacterium]|nr:hypothetical protein [Candidatus Peregrinibacteria bacterium]